MPLFTALASIVSSQHDEALLAASGPPASAPATLQGDNDRSTLLWHWIATNHFFNSSFWAGENLARRTTIGAEDIAHNKHAIDKDNQARLDTTERMDEILLIELGLVDAASAQTDAPVSKVPANARMNSETAGSIIERRSIMALKIHTLRAQTLRNDVDDVHRKSSLVKLDKLLQQLADLVSCLDAILANTQAGRAYFKVYRQFKMYNDPGFNPALVAEQGMGGGST